MTSNDPFRPLRDGYGRRVDHLRVSVTDRCDLRCNYCRPRWDPHAHVLSDSQRLQFIRVLANRCGLQQVRFTGGEPLLHAGLVDLVAATRAAAPDLTIAMTTNAGRLAAQAEALRTAGLNRLNVSLDTLDAARYHELTGGELNTVLLGLSTAKALGFKPIRVNAVALRGVNDAELPDLAAWACEEGFEMRFLEAMPIGPAAGFNREHFMSAEEILETLARRYRIEDLGRDRGATARHYRLTADGLATEIGIIAPVSRPFCGDCRRMRLTADGRLFPCLLNKDNVDLSELLTPEGVDAALLEVLETVLGAKAASGAVQPVNMVQLGG